MVFLLACLPKLNSSCENETDVNNDKQLMMSFCFFCVFSFNLFHISKHSTVTHSFQHEFRSDESLSVLVSWAQWISLGQNTTSSKQIIKKKSILANFIPTVVEISIRHANYAALPLLRALQHCYKILCESVTSQRESLNVQASHKYLDVSLLTSSYSLRGRVFYKWCNGAFAHVDDA